MSLFRSAARSKFDSFLGCLLLLGLVALLAGCAVEAKPVPAENKFRPADSPAGQQDKGATEVASAPGKATDAKAPDVTSRPAQPAKAPSGTLEELVAQFNAMGERPPQGANPQEQMENYMQTHEQRLAIGKKALSMNPDRATKEQLILGMYVTYRTFHKFGVPGAAEQLTTFAKSLAADKDPVVARFGRHIQFDFRVSTIASRPLDSGEEVVSEIRKLLDAEKGGLSRETLSTATHAAQLLVNSGLQDDAAAALNAMADAAAASSDLADEAAAYRDQAVLVKADFGAMIEPLATGEAGADKKMVELLKDVLEKISPSRAAYSEVHNQVVILETTGHAAAAAEASDMIAAHFAEVEDSELAEAVKQSHEALQKRASLVGQPFVVEGVTLEGKPFDWSAYEGKVVLVDFWATWCAPCLEEFPNIEQNYKQFKSKGFEVVGVCLNNNLEQVQQFFALQSLPWTSVTSKSVFDGEEKPTLPMAEKCGVETIPFMLLVGQDGKVDSLHVRGPKLKARLTQLLGEPEKPDVPVDPTLSPAGEASPATASPGADVGAPNSDAPAVLPPVNDRGGIGPGAGLSPAALLVAQAVLAAEPGEVAGNTEINPYRAKPGLSTVQLVTYIEKQLDKPQSIQSRPGFGEAVVEACDRVLANQEVTPSQSLFAAQTKFQMLHRLACDGQSEADEQLMAFVAAMDDDSREPIARDVKFFKLERRVLDGADLPLDELPALIQEVQDYVAKEKLSGRHLRLASGTVALVNRLEDGDVREKHFTALGALFGKSSDRELARYGQKLAKNPAARSE